MIVVLRFARNAAKVEIKGSTLGRVVRSSFCFQTPTTAECLILFTKQYKEGKKGLESSRDIKEGAYRSGEGGEGSLVSEHGTEIHVGREKKK